MIYKKNLLLNLFTVFLLIITIQVTEINANTLNLIPKPKRIEMKNFKIRIDNNWTILANISNRNEKFCATWLKQWLFSKRSIEAKIEQINLNIVDSSVFKMMLIVNKNIVLKELNVKLNSSDLSIIKEKGPEAYFIDVYDNCIIIIANQANGLFYGIQTLVQLINQDNSIEAVHITDYPDHKIRGVYLTYFSLGYMKDDPPKFTKAHRDAIDYYASLKINAIFYGDRGDFFYKEPKFLKPYIEMMEYCKERFIEFVPGVGSLKGIKALPFELLEGWWVKDEKFKFNDHDIAVPEKPFVNLLENGNLEYQINNNLLSWDIKGKFKIDQDVKFKGNNTLMLFPGSISTELPIEPGKHYYLSGFGKGNGPVFCLVVKKDKNYLYEQCDFSSSFEPSWRKFSVTIKASQNSNKLQIKIYGKGEIWIEDLKLYRVDGALKNVIRTKTSDIQIFDLEKKMVYQEGLDYEIINGEVNNIFDENLYSFKIKRLPTGRIVSGQEVLVSYDCLLNWARSRVYENPPCVSDERLLNEYYYPALKKVIESLKPMFIHLASDEIRGFNRDSRCQKRGLTNAELFAEWLKKVKGFITEKDPNCKVIIWDDMVSPFHNGGIANYQLQYGGNYGRMAEAIEKNMIDKEVILAIWWYEDKYLPNMKGSLDFFSEKGYQFFGVPWYNEDNIKTWSNLLLNRKGSLGGIDTDWWSLSEQPKRIPSKHFSIFADYFWHKRE